MVNAPGQRPGLGDGCTSEGRAGHAGDCVGPTRPVTVVTNWQRAVANSTGVGQDAAGRDVGVWDQRVDHTPRCNFQDRFGAAIQGAGRIRHTIRNGPPLARHRG